MGKDPREYLALALDNVGSAASLQDLIGRTKAFCGTYKVGLELFTRFGPSALEHVRESGRRIFLDLKFHDIPNTVAQAVMSASALGVDYCTLHTQGGSAMMAAAVAALCKAREKGLAAPKLIGVTVLTSIDGPCLGSELHVSGELSDYIKHLAGMAATAGLDGIVCSASDLGEIKPALPASFEIITPGIRSSGSAAHDQKRIATPQMALAAGGTLLVIGREVTLAEDPAAAMRKIHAETEAFLSNIPRR